MVCFLQVEHNVEMQCIIKHIVCYVLYRYKFECNTDVIKITFVVIVVVLLF